MVEFKMVLSQYPDNIVVALGDLIVCEDNSKVNRLWVSPKVIYLIAEYYSGAEFAGVVFTFDNTLFLTSAARSNAFH